MYGSESWLMEVEHEVKLDGNEGKGKHRFV